MKIAVLQMTSGIDPQANADVLVKAAQDAADAGAVMLFTPEMSGLLDRDRHRAAASIVTEQDDTVLEAVCLTAKRNRIWIALGSLAIDLDRSDGKRANRSFVIDDQGVVVARYDKVHLFDVDLASGESWRESSAFVGGARAVTVATPLGVLGLSVCYDLRFPQLFQQLTNGGATILSIPAAFTVPTGLAHWHILMRARAIENASFVVAAAQTGTHEDGRITYGHSLVIGPWGDVLLDMGSQAGLGYCEIEPGEVDRVRARIPVIGHRRDVSL